MSLVNEAQKPNTAKRVTYGIVITIGTTTFNEWGLHESEAKVVNELLTINGDQPLPATSDGVVFSRRAPSNMASELAALRAKLTPAS